MRTQGILVVFAVTGSALLFALTGCGEDECFQAQEHFYDCLHVSGVARLKPKNQEACEGALLCRSRCVNEADCDAFPRPDLPAMPTEATRSLLECETKCGTAAGPGL